VAGQPSGVPGESRCTRRHRALVRVLLLVALGALLTSAFFVAPDARHDVTLGVTFSPRYARSLGFDPESLYAEVLDDLGVSHVRLPVYWDEVEVAPGEFDFSALDSFLETARRRGVQVILVVGYKQPRWPECYPPPWAADLPADQLRTRILELVAAEVTHARTYPNVIMWQVENEPFRLFGECRDYEVLTPEFVAEEMRIIRGLDSRPLLVTDTGELSTWFTAMRLSDHYLGSTLYRVLWFPSIGLWRYPVPVWLYIAKDRLVRTLLQKPGETIVIELQAEAWFTSISVAEAPIEMQKQHFPASMVLANVEYARRTQFASAYLWGVEWWYWMKMQGHSEYVEAARQAFGRSARYHGA